MGKYFLATSRQVCNPVRCQRWDASIRAGDDFKLALTVYGDDDATPASVTVSRSQLVLWPDSQGPRTNDYGWGLWTGGSLLGGVSVQTAGFSTALRPGGINFFLPSNTTAGLCHGRYQLLVQVDLPDGSYTQVEGILQVRQNWWQFGQALGHLDAAYFTLDMSQLDGTMVLAPAVVDGVPCDLDGFPLVFSEFVAGLSADTLAALLATLPTTLPDDAGVLWNDAGVICLS